MLKANNTPESQVNYMYYNIQTSRFQSSLIMFHKVYLYLQTVYKTCCTKKVV